MSLFYYVICSTFNVFLSFKRGHFLIFLNSTAQSNEYPLNRNHCSSVQCYIHVFIKERDGERKKVYFLNVRMATKNENCICWCTSYEKLKRSPLKANVRKCQRGTEPETRVWSGKRRAEASLASTSWRNCVLQLSLFSACFSFPIFTTEAHLPATNQLPDQDSEPG